MANFKARARALDMLGRQQIAGIPTAISELFKNAHDAYADNVVADYFERDNLFVLRDDGVGMSEADFIERWLVLGTESKVGSATGVKPPRRDPSKQSRPVLGEKGIGRLAIAAIGPQVLILTRPKVIGQDEESTAEDTRLTAAFIHWGLFEIPGVNLDEVEVQIQTFVGGQVPTRIDVEKMVEATRQNVYRLKNSIDQDQVSRILDELKQFDVDPLILGDRLRRPTLKEVGCGTHFFIQPTADSLSANLRVDANDERISDLTKTLIGFTNTMTPGHELPQINTIFRYHKADGTSSDLIGQGEFFTPDEFNSADHRIQGAFDEYGQFSGTLSIFDFEPKTIVVPWAGSHGKQTDCGPFTIDWAYIQGRRSETQLPPEDFARIFRKVNRMGGLYVYRDGIRVQPYGNTDVDFLDIEKRRSKHAGYYFFSYRRMFGVINITHQENAGLSEKAGREGFRDNRAYRQFKEILINLLVQLAAEYFREEGAQAEQFRKKLAEHSRLEKARQQREKKAGPKRKAFENAVNQIGERIQSGQPQREIEEIMNTFRMKVTTATDHRSGDPEQGALLLIEAEAEAKNKVEEVRKSYRITRPTGVALTPALRREYEAHSFEWRALEENLFLPTISHISEETNASFEVLGTSVETRLRLDLVFRESIERIKREAERHSRQIRTLIAENARLGEAVVRDSLVRVYEGTTDILKDIATTNFISLSDDALLSWQNEMEQRLAQIETNNEDLLQNLEAQFQGLSLKPDEEGHISGATEEAEALEEEILALQERADNDFELSQLGLAVEVVGHEFSNSIQDVRDNLRTLDTWAKKNPSLQKLSHSLRTSFEHLDGYLTLFTPMNRRLYRAQSQVTGKLIAGFIEGLMSKHLDEAKVKLEVTDAFLAKKLVGYPSTFYPVFVNLVDNAIFWVGNTPQPRRILLDADDNGFIISDSGPGVARSDRDVIFEMRFSRKPGGRGLGLFIARKGLDKDGYLLYLAESGPLRGATFRIEPKRTRDEAFLNQM